jgi:hypothetical protein
MQPLTEQFLLPHVAVVRYRIDLHDNPTFSNVQLLNNHKAFYPTGQSVSSAKEFREGCAHFCAQCALGYN